MQDRGRQMPLKQMPWRQVMQQESTKLLALTTDLPWDRSPSHSLRLNQRPLRTAGHLQRPYTEHSDEGLGESSTLISLELISNRPVSATVSSILHWVMMIPWVTTLL